MVQKLKKIGIIAGLVLAFAGVIALLIITAGKNRRIKELMQVVTDSWQKNVLDKENDNKTLTTEWNKLTAQEKAIIEMIKNEPSLHIPEEIDENDYQAVLKWFRAMEKHYD